MSRRISAIVAALGHRLPHPVQQATPFLLWKRAGDLVFISGQVSRFDELDAKGKAGVNLNLAQARAAAEWSALNMLAWLVTATDDHEARVASCVKLSGFVSCSPDFTEQSQVIGAASDLIVAVFGERGRHARTAVGVPSLPFDYAVSIDAIFELG